MFHRSNILWTQVRLVQATLHCSLSNSKPMLITAWNPTYIFKQYSKWSSNAEVCCHRSDFLFCRCILAGQRELAAHKLRFRCRYADVPCRVVWTGPHRPDDGGSTHLWNVGLLRDNTPLLSQNAVFFRPLNVLRLEETEKLVLRVWTIKVSRRIWLAGGA
jgi:hypothetical protein